MTGNGDMSRRGFLKAGSASVASAAVGAGWLASSASRRASTARAAERAAGANDRLVFGVIGVGGMGSGHVKHLLSLAEAENLEIAAVCDVYRKRANANAARGKAKPYEDYRRLLDDKAIDCVVIATPDHWHFQNALDAIDAGKHVYLQKPMVHTIEQAIKLRNRVRQHRKVVLQVGTQHTGQWAYWSANEAIRDGLIGDVLWTQASYSRNKRGGEWNYPIDASAGPDGTGDEYINWDMWLGHEFGCAPKVAWNPEHFFRFRKYWSYSGGIATDLFYHKLAPILLAIEGPQGAYPRRVSSGGGTYVQKDGREVPDTSVVTIDYPGEHTVVLTSSMANDDQPPEKIRGRYGTIELSGKVQVQSPWRAEFHAKSGGEDTVVLDRPDDWDDDRRSGHEGHLRNFLDVVRGERTQLNCGVELAAATQVAITMSVLAYRRQQTLIWDGMKEEAHPA